MCNYCKEIIYSDNTKTRVYKNGIFCSEECQMKEHGFADVRNVMAWVRKQNGKI